jgi:hypothetical protein
MTHPSCCTACTRPAITDAAKVWSNPPSLTQITLKIMKRSCARLVDACGTHRSHSWHRRQLCTLWRQQETQPSAHSRKLTAESNDRTQMCRDHRKNLLLTPRARRATSSTVASTNVHGWLQLPQLVRVSKPIASHREFVPENVKVSTRRSTRLGSAACRRVMVTVRHAQRFDFLGVAAFARRAASGALTCFARHEMPRPRQTSYKPALTMALCRVVGLSRSAAQCGAMLCVRLTRGTGSCALATTGGGIAEESGRPVPNAFRWRRHGSVRVHKPQPHADAKPLAVRALAYQTQLCYCFRVQHAAEYPCGC